VKKVGPRDAPGAAVVALRAALVLAACGSATAAASNAAGGGRACRVPRLTGLTLEAARARAVRAGCELRVTGARLTSATTQTVARQSPRAGGRGAGVTVWANPLCHGQAAYGPGIPEPLSTPGPTKLVSGFYLSGGPVAKFSSPRCKRPAPTPGAGTVQVIDAAGAVVATGTSARGQLVEIPLPAGTYSLRGTFLDASDNGAHPTETESLVIAAGHTLRRDFFLDIP
jgi:hypothetical protein